MTAEGNDPLTKMAISATQLTLFFAIFLRYFSRLHRTNFSQIPQDLSLSCNPGLLLFWLLFPLGVGAREFSLRQLGALGHGRRAQHHQLLIGVSRGRDVAQLLGGAGPAE